MRGRSECQTSLICLLNLEDRISKTHPIREVKKLVETALKDMDGCFNDMYSKEGRPSVPPECLLKAKVLMALYSMRSDRQFCERLQHDLLFQWFMDINPDEEDRMFNASTFSKNQKRLLDYAASDIFFKTVVGLANDNGWVSNEHFSVDGTLIESWAGMKSFRPKGEPTVAAAGATGTEVPKDNNGWADFQGEKRSNDTHESKTDPEAKLAKKGKGKEAKLSFGAHAVMENRNGLCMDFEVASVNVTETVGGLDGLGAVKDQGLEPKTVGGDKNYHNKGFVTGCREMDIEAHVAQIKGRKVDGIDEVLTGKPGYKASLIVRRRIEQIFGWVKTTGCFRKSRYWGIERTRQSGHFVVTAYNLLRMAKISIQEAKAVTQ